MAIKSYPYSSIDGYRKITASDEAKRLDLIADSGIIFDDATSFECSKVAGTMNINVAAGSALVAGHGIISDDTETVAIYKSDSSYSRIDVIALESNANTGLRTGRIVVIKGTAALTPVEPALNTAAGVKQIKLAKILIPANIASLSTATLTDMRSACVGKHKHSKAQITGVSSWNGIIGEIKAFAGCVAPAGTMLCDGTAVSRMTYATLFDTIGTTWGSGDGSTTFNIPNLKGRIPVGYDFAQKEFNVLGKTGGSKDLQAHAHGIWGTSGTRNLYDGASIWQYQAIDTSNPLANASGSFGLGDSGNLQPYAVVNYIIVYA